MSLPDELKRRNIYRSAAAYLFTGWLLIEVGGAMFAAMGFPAAATRWLILLVAAGLLPLLAITWRYEITPGGLLRDDGSGRNRAENARTGRRMEQVSIVIAMLVLSAIATKRFVLPEQADAPPPAAAVAAAPAPAPAVTAPAVPVDPRSIAVMPFANLSPDPGNEYFADGIAEELLNVLAKVEGLKVASRTSAFSFKGKTTGIREIGRELGVAHVLEGSVRMQGNTVRITAQLIDASNDKHLWSDTYDREMDDIFAVQEEIATAITAVLKDLLGAQTVSVERPTTDLEAYELFLRGRPLYFQRGSALFTARDLLTQAVERDPRFAQAWATLSATHYVLPSHFGDIDVAASSAAAREAADKALALDQTQSIAWAVLSMLATDSGRRDEAAELMKKALAHDPNDATAWLWSGISAVQSGHLADARRSFERARSLDPLVGINSSWLGVIKLMDGEMPEGKALLARARDLGGVGDPLWALIQLGVADGPSEQLAKRLRDYLPQDPARPARQQAMWNAVADALADSAARPVALAAVQAAIAAHPEDRHSEALQLLGYYPEAIAEEMRVPDGYSDFLARIWYPHDKALREHPDYLELARKRGLFAYWEQGGFPDHCTLAQAPAPHLECAR